KTETQIFMSLQVLKLPIFVNPLPCYQDATYHHHCPAQMALDVLSCPATSTDVERCQAFATISQCLCFPPSLLLVRGLAKGLFPTRLVCLVFVSSCGLVRDRTGQDTPLSQSHLDFRTETVSETVLRQDRLCRSLLPGGQCQDVEQIHAEHCGLQRAKGKGRING
ncbi:hypothetical protein PROFUN_08078, partial [Planoprotostelium fungivorum]